MVRSQALAGEGAERGKQRRARNEKKKGGVAGASSGDRFIKHTRSGGGAQQQRPEEGGPRKCILSRIGSRARAHHGKRRGQIHYGIAVMLRPLLVRRIQQRPLGARRQLAEARGEKGAQGHGARAFSPPPLLLREFFFAAGGALGRQPSFRAGGAGWA